MNWDRTIYSLSNWFFNHWNVIAAFISGFIFRVFQDRLSIKFQYDYKDKKKIISGISEAVGYINEWKSKGFVTRIDLSYLYKFKQIPKRKEKKEIYAYISTLEQFNQLPFYSGSESRKKVLDFVMSKDLNKIVDRLVQLLDKYGN